LLAIHELGHASVARLLGWRVTDMVVGYGRELVRFRVGATLVRIQLAPIGGYVIPSPRNMSLPRLKSALIFAAGPGAEVLVVLALLAFDSQLFSGEEDVQRVALRAVAYVVGISLFFNLVPLPLVGGVNDGLGVILSLFLSPRSFRARMLAPELMEATRCLIVEETQEAREILVEARKLHGDDSRLVALSATVAAADGRHTEAQAMLEEADARAREEALENPESRDSSSPYAFRAWTFLNLGDEGLRTFALRDARHAFEASGGDVLPSVLYGRALLALGRNRAAYAALMTGFKRARVSEDEGLCAAYLALAAHRALAIQEPRQKGMPYIAPDHPERFLSALDRYVVGPRLKREVTEEFEAFRAVRGD